MAEMNGWIKLHRKMLENPIVMKDADHLAVWVYLLLNATHTDYPALFKGKRITMKPGQLLTGRKSLSDKLDIDENKVKRILKCFESDHQIDRQRSNKNSLITIRNWESYQDYYQQNDQQVTSNRPASDQQVTTNKNERMKECKNVRSNIFIPPTVADVSAYCANRQNNVDAESFVDFYSSKGWMVGRNKMKDWKAAVRTWERSRGNESFKKKTAADELDDFYKMASAFGEGG